jgi:hypothetical protein
VQAPVHVERSEVVMNRTVGTSLIVILAVAVTVLGILYYQQREREHSVDINVGGAGLTIKKNP